MSSVSENTTVSNGLQVLGMILLSMGLYAIVLWWTVPVALLSWPGAGSTDASLGLIAFDWGLGVVAGLLLLASLFCLIERWLLVVGMLVVAVLTFSGTAPVLSCVLLISRIRTIGPALWRTLLVAVASSTITILVAYVCAQVAAGSGPINGQPPPTNPVFPLVSLLVGILDILIIYFWLRRKGSDSSRPVQLRIREM